MKRAALLIITLLSLQPFTAFAQSGWVRIADGPWQRTPIARFQSNSLGFAQEVVNANNSDYGANIYLTTDGGESWKAFNNFRGGEIPCNEGYYQYRRYISVIAGVYLNSRKLHIIAAEGISTCYNDVPWFTSSVWSYDLGAQEFKVKNFLGRGPSSLQELADGTLVASSDDYMYWGDRGPGTALLSTDSGNTWRQLLWGEGNDSRQFIASFSNKDTGYVGTTFWDSAINGAGSALRWTTDGGASWRRDTIVAVPHIDFFYGPHYGNNSLWYAQHLETDEGWFATSDGGQTWFKTDVAPNYDPWRAGEEFYNSRQGYRITHRDSLHSTIEYTSDSGAGWSQQVEIEGYLTSIAAPSNTVAFAFGRKGLFYKTTDGGGRFASVASTDEKRTKLRAWSNGSTIIIENASDEIRVLDLLGRVVRNGEKLDGIAPGLYFVVSGEESVRVLVAPL